LRPYLDEASHRDLGPFERPTGWGRLSERQPPCRIELSLVRQFKLEPFPMNPPSSEGAVKVPLCQLGATPRWNGHECKAARSDWAAVAKRLQACEWRITQSDLRIDRSLILAKQHVDERAPNPAILPVDHPA